jgi:predicted AAA+ superfamily ATPase
MTLPRIYTPVFLNLLRQDPQMLFVSGARQSGKTTVARSCAECWDGAQMLNWDRLPDRQLILEGPDRLAELCGLPRVAAERELLVLDEFHKFDGWKNYLKSLFDTYQAELQVLVTGSARLGVFHRGGDSLMGRYFPFTLHALSIAELLDPTPRDMEHLVRPCPLPVPDSVWEPLLRFGGFPDPFVRQQEVYWRRWQSLRFRLLFEEEIADLTRIQKIKQLELTAKLLQEQAGQLTSFASLAKKTQASSVTVKEWCQVLHAVYFAFPIAPWSHQVSRSLMKEPKWFLFDWSTVVESGARLENLVACHLLKAVDWWNDRGFGQFSLHFVRDNLQNEVDFLVVRDQKPWMLLEVKQSDRTLSRSLRLFADQLKPRYCLQLVDELPQTTASFLEFDDQPRLLSLRSFLSQLV